MERLQFGHALARWWWLLTLSVVLAVQVSIVSSLLSTPTYRSTATLLVNQVQTPGAASYQDLLTSQTIAKTYSELLRSRSVAEETIRQLKLPLTPRELVARTRVLAIRDTQLVAVSVEDPDPVRSPTIVNGLVQVFIARVAALQAGQAQMARLQVDQEIADVQAPIADTNARLVQARANEGDPQAPQQLQSDLTQREDTYLKLLETQQRLAIAQAQTVTSVSVTEPGEAGERVGLRPKQAAVLAGCCGLLVSIGLVLLLTYLDDRLREPEGALRLFNVPALATVQLVRTGARGDHLIKAMRLLRTNVGFLTLGKSAALCVTSAVAGEGKSTITANLALAEAQTGKRAIVIDCDLRKPTLHALFGLANTQDLSTCLAQSVKCHEPHWQEGPSGIRVVTAGPVPPNPTGLLGTLRMASLVEQACAQAEIVLIDSAPLLDLADTLVLQPYVDGFILVVNAQSTGARVLQRAFTVLEQTSGRVLDLVLNKDRGKLSASYGYAYGYGREDNGVLHRWKSLLARPRRAGPS